MPTELDLLTRALTTPLLEPELSGQQIGRNRLNVIEQISKILGNATIQVWLVEPHGDQIENRLAYWYPKVQNLGQLDLLGHIVVDPLCAFKSKSRNVPSEALLAHVKALFRKFANTESVGSFPLLNPIPK